MPLRKYKIIGTRTSVNPETKEEIHYVDLELQDTVSIRFKSPSQLLNYPVYEALIGQTISLNVREGEMNGQPWTNFTNDGMPTVNVDPREFLKGKPGDVFGVNFNSKPEIVDPTTGEILDNPSSNLKSIFPNKSKPESPINSPMPAAKAS